MEALVKQMVEIYKMMGSDDFADAVATMLWNIYSKAKAKGFSEEDAMAITLSFAKSQANNK